MEGRKPMKLEMEEDIEKKPRDQAGHKMEIDDKPRIGRDTRHVKLQATFGGGRRQNGGWRAGKIVDYPVSIASFLRIGNEQS
jgi:hypothetical protein